MFTAYLLFAVLLLNSCFSFRDEDVVGVEDGKCKRERREIVVEWPNCDETYTKVPTCYGSCRSYDIVIPSAPYFEKQCNCCKSAHHKVKKKKLLFNCNGRMENHTVYFPKIEKCVCEQCNVL